MPAKPPCFLTEEWTKLALRETKQVNHDSKLLEFALPSSEESLQLPVCACLLLKAPGKGENGDDVVRPYTPVSDDLRKGSFDLLVKVYEKGTASKFLGDLKSGDEVEFKHIPFNVKEQYPFGKKSIVMLAGGSGITPMFQALQSIFRDDGFDDDLKVTLLYGNKTEKDILLQEELEEIQATNLGRLEIVNILSESSWDGETGFIDGEKIKKFCPPPSDSQLVFVCGPPPMYESLCGPRGESEVTGILAKLGYSNEVVKF